MKQPKKVSLRKTLLEDAVEMELLAFIKG